MRIGNIDIDLSKIPGSRSEYLAGSDGNMREYACLPVDGKHIENVFTGDRPFDDSTIMHLEAVQSKGEGCNYKVVLSVAAEDKKKYKAGWLKRRPILGRLKISETRVTITKFDLHDRFRQTAKVHVEDNEER